MRRDDDCERDVEVARTTSRAASSGITRLPHSSIASGMIARQVAHRFSTARPRGRTHDARPISRAIRASRARSGARHAPPFAASAHARVSARPQCRRRTRPWSLASPRRGRSADAGRRDEHGDVGPLRPVAGERRGEVGHDPDRAAVRPVVDGRCDLTDLIAGHGWGSRITAPACRRASVGGVDGAPHLDMRDLAVGP